MSEPMSERRERRSVRSRRAAERAATTAWWRRPAVLAAALAALALLAAALALRGNGGGAAGPSGEAAVPCSGTEMTRNHVHAHLVIDIRGTPLVVPANIGIRSNCLFWLHTHDDTGLIHVEADVPANYTLGQFFTVWGQPLSRDAVLGERVGPSEEVRVLVNGQPYSGDPRAVPLAAHEQIVVQLGPPFPAPLPFTFPPGS